jgi:hypothetical protein
LTNRLLGFEMFRVHVELLSDFDKGEVEKGGQNFKWEIASQLTIFLSQSNNLGSKLVKTAFNAVAPFERKHVLDLVSQVSLKDLSLRPNAFHKFIQHMEHS